MRKRVRSSTVIVLAIVVAVLAAIALPASATSASPLCLTRTNDTYKEVLDCVTVAGVRVHQGAFQLIANRNNNEFYPDTRAAGTEGYRNSALYVAGLLRLAGYKVTLDPFEFEFVGTLLSRSAPTTTRYITGPFAGSGAGTVTNTAVVPIDINLAGDRANTSGCEDADFAGFPAGAIALIQRGTCAFGDKAFNADEAGASAVVIFNQGNTPEREGLIVGGTLALPAPTEPIIDIPVVDASFATGAELAQPGTRATVRVLIETRTDHNVIAELPGAKDDNVVMAGAHLDSETQGPGINDNGSGSAALLETALVMRKLKPENTLRFAWWGAEEAGLLGSTAYVEGLPQADRDDIAMYLNYDMVGSPNYIFMVYDANQSTFPAPEGVPIPPGSEAIENLYERYYTLVGEPYDDTEFSGRSDYQAFIEAGIPSGGLFTGAEELKTEAQQAIWGGTTGEQLDPCYHIACDTFGNVSRHALEINSDLIAFAQLTFAYSTESVNGVPGKKVPGPPVNLPPPAGPEGTFADDAP